MDTADARNLPLAVLNERRRRAVKLRERGMTLREVTSQVELSVPTVMSAHRAYREGGWAAVDVKPRGRKRGEGRELAPEQEAEICRLICDKTPDQLKLGFALWDRQAVSQLIEDWLGIKVAHPHRLRVPQALGIYATDADQEGLRAAPGGSAQTA